MKYALALACLFATTTYAPPASACSCAYPISIEERIADTPHIFSAEILDKSTSGGCNGPAYRHHRVQVLTTWKGDVTGEVTVTTPSGGPACGIDLDVGERYVLWAYGERDQLRVGLCSGIDTVANATEDIAALETFGAR